MTKNNNEKLNGQTMLLFIIVLIALFVILALSIRSGSKYASASINVPYPPPKDCNFAIMKLWDEEGGYSGIFWRPPITEFACYIWVGADERREFHFYNDSCTRSGICAMWFAPGQPVTVYKLEGAQVDVQQVKIYTTQAINRWIPEVINK